jgi:hypothetical protein
VQRKKEREEEEEEDEGEEKFGEVLSPTYMPSLDIDRPVTERKNERTKMEKK